MPYTIKIICISITAMNRVHLFSNLRRNQFNLPSVIERRLIDLNNDNLWTDYSWITSLTFTVCRKFHWAICFPIPQNTRESRTKWPTPIAYASNPYKKQYKSGIPSLTLWSLQKSHLNSRKHSSTQFYFIKREMLRLQWIDSGSISNNRARNCLRRAGCISKIRDHLWSYTFLYNDLCLNSTLFYRLKS